jgi:energy-coupling factor transporter ATP-binding protein EcfA2
MFRIGPHSHDQLDRLARCWEQGDHVLVTGGTNSGKTVLARELDEIRLKRGGSVVVFVCKLRPDATITERYKGFTRWTTWHKNPSVTENRILFWPKVEKLSPTKAVALMKDKFTEALEEIGKTGRWTVHIDEGLFVASPAYLALGNTLGMMYALMRSSKGTMITLAQRPAHLPVAIYPNLSHAFVGRASELPDIKRLADMDGATNSRELQRMIQNNGKHDFIWIPVGQDWPPERINLME